MRRQKMRAEFSAPRDVIPAVVIDNQKLRVIEPQVIEGIGDVAPRFNVGRNVFGAPIFIIKTQNQCGRAARVSE